MRARYKRWIVEVETELTLRVDNVYRPEAP